MPLYDYKCETCSVIEEYLAKYDDAQVLVCPVCQQETMTRQTSVPALFQGLPTRKFFD